MRSTLLLAGLLLLLPRVLAESPAPSTLAACLTGTFTSADQAQGDQNFRDLTLHVVPVWTDRSDGPWFYYEQSLTDAPDHPYRQRLYQLAARPDGAFEIRIFDLPDAVALTGAWKNPSLLAGLNPASLTPQPGCILVLRRQPDGSFKGGTEGKACANTLHGASYATTEITVSERQTITWERGYNAGDTQVWGSSHGGYIFKKI
jgi:hypothetical protein